MAEAQSNIPILNRKEWQTMMPAHIATAAGSFVAADQSGLSRYSLYMLSGTVHYLYDHLNDDYLPITSGAAWHIWGRGLRLLSSVVSYFYCNRWNYNNS